MRKSGILGMLVAVLLGLTLSIGYAADGGSTDDTGGKVALVVGLVFLGIVATGIIQGVTDKAIFFMNGSDLGMTFIPLVAIPVLGVGSFLVKSGNNPVPNWYWSIAGLVEAGLFVWIYYRAFHFNERSYFLAITTGTAKISLSFFVIFKFLGITSYDENKSHGQNMANQVSSAIWFSLAAALMTKLVNGERVLEARAPENAYATAE